MNTNKTIKSLIIRFICTETGGSLCNKNGACIFQWKWDDVSLYEFEKFKNELSLDVNKQRFRDVSDYCKFSSQIFLFLLAERIYSP